MPRRLGSRSGWNAAIVLIAGCFSACSAGKALPSGDGGPLQGSAGAAGHSGQMGGGGGGAGGSAGSASSGESGSGGITGDGGVTGHDDCQTDADCPQGVCAAPPCSELLCALGGDGFHHCVSRTLPPLDTCPDSGVEFGSCCTSDSACTAQPHGHCIPQSLGWCAGPPPQPINDCRYDACSGDADCTASPDGFCTAGYPRVCLYGPCRTNTDCTRGSGGRCVMLSVGTYCPGDVVFCRYADDPCTDNAGCPSDGGFLMRACLPNTDLQGASCQNVGLPPP